MEVVATVGKPPGYAAISSVPYFVKKYSPIKYYLIRPYRPDL